MTLAALLEELKEVDAEQSEKLQCWIGRTRQFMDLEVPLECDLAQALIQASIQRACERWGWLWTHSKEDSKSEAAIAGTPYEAIIFDDEVNIIVEDIYGASAAEALLAAYIAAVREEAK